MLIRPHSQTNIKLCMAHNALCSMALLPEQVLYLEMIFYTHKTYPTWTEAEKQEAQKSVFNGCCDVNTRIGQALKWKGNKHWGNQMLMSILMLMRGLWVSAMGYNSQTIFIKSTENSLATVQGDTQHDSIKCWSVRKSGSMLLSLPRAPTITKSVRLFTLQLKRLAKYNQWLNIVYKMFLPLLWLIDVLGEHTHTHTY